MPRKRRCDSISFHREEICKLLVRGPKSRSDMPYHVPLEFIKKIVRKVLKKTFTAHLDHYETILGHGHSFRKGK
ncbi:hypothetical protein COOONC_01342 [Cooperia oncophora]